MTHWAAAPYRAIGSHIQLRTTWWHQWRRGILKNDSSVGVTSVTGKYKCWDGRLSAHTSRLGLYGSRKRCGRLRATITTVRSTRGWERGDFGYFPGEAGALQNNTYRKYSRSIFCVGGSALSYLGRSNLFMRYSHLFQRFLNSVTFNLPTFFFCKTSLKCFFFPMHDLLFDLCNWSELKHRI